MKNDVCALIRAHEQASLDLWSSEFLVISKNSATLLFTAIFCLKCSENC